MCRKGLVSTLSKPIAWAIAVLAVSAGAGLVPQAAAAGPHDFNYDPIGQTYTVNDETIRASDVQRDLAGVLCSKCHPEAVAQLKSSVHFRTQAPNPRILFPGGGAHGMLDRACGLPGSTALINYVSDVNLAECGKCHTGRYLPVMQGAFQAMFAASGLPGPAEQAERIVNAGVDCLICHAGEYHAVPSGNLAAVADHATANTSPVAAGFPRAARDDGDFDHDGSPDPVIDIDGDGNPDVPLMVDANGDGMPDAPWPTIAQDRDPSAVLSVGPTSERTCLRCHEHGRSGYKRGTPFDARHDVHAAATVAPFAGANNRCTVCHTSSAHKFVRGHGVGGDLAAADFPPPPAGAAAHPADETDVTCERYHDPKGLRGMVHHRQHLDRIACETCHIRYTSGITYSLYGHGAHLAFGRNAQGKDTKLITLDHMQTTGTADAEADFEAYKTTPTLVWFNGATSFLAQTLAVRGSPNAKIAPFKPMANGMVFDARFFRGDNLFNAVQSPYNAYSMYRFFANAQDDCAPGKPCGNAEVFAALGLLDLSAAETRSITLADFQASDARRQAMAMMLVFPNMVNFDKQTYGYEHYLVSRNSPWDLNNDGTIDAGQPFLFDMLGAANMGLRKFQGFNAPMGLPAEYAWYPAFDKASQLITMKEPDGSLMKMFLKMQAAGLPADKRAAFLAALANYPAYSNGVTLGGHGVLPKGEALGAEQQGCPDCHGENGVLTRPIPVDRKVLTQVNNMQVELTLYQWKYYNVRGLVDLGVSVRDEDVVAGRADIDIDGDGGYVRTSTKSFVLNWFAPSATYIAADDKRALAGTALTTKNLTWNGGKWMPVLEPVVDYVPNYAVLGYQRSEVIWPRGRGR